MKKLICLILSIILLQASIVVSAQTSSVDISDEEREGIITALRDVEYAKNEMGLGAVDFADIYIANPVRSYVFTDSGLEESYEHIPLLVQNCLVAYAVNVEGKFHISTYLVDKAKNISNILGGYAFIYDVGSVYLYDGTSLTFLANSGVVTEGRARIDSTDKLTGANIDIVGATDKVFLGYTQESQPRMPIYYDCDVNYVPQGNYDICWAASIACIVNYKNNSNLTAIDVARAFYGPNFNRGITRGQEATILQNYGLYYTTLKIFATENEILLNIMDNYPVYATCRGVNANADHDVVIYGINISSGLLYVMDPNFGSATVYYDASTNQYYYYAPSGGSRHNFKYATCHEWSH